MGQTKPILVTGVAGFIGFHLARRLLQEGHRVIGIDNLNPYYDVNLKKARLSQLTNQSRFEFHQLDITNEPALRKIFEDHQFEKILHMAAQAGVRYSLTNPEAYIQSNLIGFANILEACHRFKVKHLLFASSSSVYGGNTTLPFSTNDMTDKPLNLYAATKKSNELMAYAYSHLYQFPCTGLRFFTVYGPWGRPDMALFIFTKAILEGQPIDLYNKGQMKRDFTYIDDVVECVLRLLKTKPLGCDSVPYSIFNVGGHRSIELNYFIEILEKKLGKKAKKRLLSLQPGDVPETFADIKGLKEAIHYYPETRVEEGVCQFVDWYLEYFDLPAKN